MMKDVAALDYGKLLQVLSNVEEMGDNVFHPATVHKPTVSITSPMVWANVADFNVTFEWTLTVGHEWQSVDRQKWTRVKNIVQFLRKLNAAGEKDKLCFTLDWSEVEFGVRGGNPLPNNVIRSHSLVMYVGFVVKGTTYDQRAAIEEQIAAQPD